MLTFRKIKLEDLDTIYNSHFLRPLITTFTKGGKKFVVVIDEDGCLKGGVSGCIIDGHAFISCIIIQNTFNKDALKDGLIRSLIYILDRNGVKMLSIMNNEKDELLYKRIGFKTSKTDHKPSYYLTLNLTDFFNKRQCKD